MPFITLDPGEANQEQIKEVFGSIRAMAYLCGCEVTFELTAMDHGGVFILEVHGSNEKLDKKMGELE